MNLEGTTARSHLRCAISFSSCYSSCSSSSPFIIHRRVNITSASQSAVLHSVDGVSSVLLGSSILLAPDLVLDSGLHQRGAWRESGRVICSTSGHLIDSSIRVIKHHRHLQHSRGQPPIQICAVHSGRQRNTVYSVLGGCCITIDSPEFH